MFKISELKFKNTSSASAIELAQGFATQAEALVALKRHLIGFTTSGHNSEENYWWARNEQGLWKYWFSQTG